MAKDIEIDKCEFPFSERKNLYICKNIFDRKGMRYKLLVVIFLLSLVVKAGSLPSLAIEMVDGAEDIFILEDMPVITLSDTELKVKTEHLSVIYEIDNVRNYHFKDADQGIGDGSINNNLYFINAEEIEVNGPDIKMVTLCDLNGVTLLNVPNGGGKINLSCYPPGVYIFTIYSGDKHQSVKFIK